MLFLVWDIIYTALQFYRLPIDGDVTNLAMPVDSYEPVFNDPLGFGILSTGEGHGGSNRYFSHLALYGVYNQGPLFWQRFVDPIDSIYFTNTALKLFIHLMMIGVFLLYARRISQSVGKLSPSYWLLIVGFTFSLFQTRGNVSVMGIIDPAASFNFFYSLPMLFFLLVFYPYWSWLVGGKYPKYAAARAAVNSLVALPLCLSGPLIAPTVLLIGAGIFLLRINVWYGAKRISLRALDVGLIILLLCGLYSFYLGTFNVENDELWLPYGERYLLLMEGFARIFYRKPGFMLLTIMLGINFYLLKKLTYRKTNLLHAIRFLTLFSLTYLLLLPLGGYREYRPYFIRWDTLLPVTVVVMIALISSSVVLLRHLPLIARRNLLIALCAITIFFTFQDLHNPMANTCEREALEVLSKSTSETVKLEQDCSVLSWDPIYDKQESYSKGVMLQRWGITEKRKLYFTPSQ